MPPDFEGFAHWEKMHCPRPTTPMTDDVFNRYLSLGFSRAMDEFGCPVGCVWKAYNYYTYMSTPVQPTISSGEESLEAHLQRYERTLAEIVPRIGALWREQWLPSILPGLEKTRRQDYASMSDQGLLAAFNEALERFGERYVIHGKINFNLVSASRFADFYNQHFHPEDETEAYDALQGFPTKSLEAGRGLWHLSRMIKRSPTLTELFEKADTRELPGLLEQSQEGSLFLENLRVYLDDFGWRNDVFELMDPSWRENPVIPLNALQGYLHLQDTDDPDVRYQQAIQRRLALVSSARAQLSSDELEEFDRLYEAASDYLTVTEDHNYYIDQIGNTIMRLPLLEAGSRLVRRHLINEPNDVFRLHVAELQEALEAGADFRTTTADRRIEMEKWALIIPPPTLGMRPPPSGDPFEEGIIRMFGVLPEPSSDPLVINGLPASPGVVQGRARVVRHLEEASKLRKGDIMVCEMTMPPWTPLFSTVAAVVADTGGILSHCAIVAREYRMPCVVATVIGTSVIHDGMLLTVDGSKGLVRIDATI
jgi:phosphohistidine swiveling domain-containing protein